MAMAAATRGCRLIPSVFKTPSPKPHALSSFSCPPPPTPHSGEISPDEVLISEAVSILTHRRSKSRWAHLRSLCAAGISPSAIAEITLRLRRNPRLAYRFFLWTESHPLCKPSLVSYATAVHVFARSRLNSLAQSLLRPALRLSGVSSRYQTPEIFETLVKTYRTCDSAPLVFDLLIEACLDSSRIDEALAVVRTLGSRAIHPLVDTCNSLIRSVSRLRGAHSAYAVYREVFGLDDQVRVRTRACPNVHTFNELMLSFYQDSAAEKVVEMWAEMEKSNCVPSAYSYSILMATYCEEGRMKEAERLWEEMRVEGLKHDVVVYNTMISGYCKVKDLGRAEEFVREMEMSGIESTCATHESLINGYCIIGDTDSAMLLSECMCRKGFTPDDSTVDALIGGLCDKGRVSEGLTFLRAQMKSHGFSPRRKSYQLLIKGLIKDLRMGEALKLQEEMVGKGFNPCSELYSAFIDGYIKDGNEERAELLRKEMLEYQLRQK